MSPRGQTNLTVQGQNVALNLRRPPPLGWRFWRRGGWASDPYQPTPYGGTRCIILGACDTELGTRFVCAMETDHALTLQTAHALFPDDDQYGVSIFAATILDELAQRPAQLFPHRARD